RRASSAPTRYQFSLYSLPSLADLPQPTPTLPPMWCPGPRTLDLIVAHPCRNRSALRQVQLAPLNLLASARNDVCEQTLAGGNAASSRSDNGDLGQGVRRNCQGVHYPVNASQGIAQGQGDRLDACL